MRQKQIFKQLAVILIADNIADFQHNAQNMQGCLECLTSKNVRGCIIKFVALLIILLKRDS
jgi:hypothetical protein